MAVGFIMAARKLKRPTKRAPDAGSLARFQAFFYALAFFQLDGFAVPAPARVTQTVGHLIAKAQIPQQRR